MIQRIQSLYLLFVVSTCAWILFGKVVIFDISGQGPWTEGKTGKIEVSFSHTERILDGTVTLSYANPLLQYALAVIGGLALLSIFLYNNRKLQLLFCGFNYLFTALLGVLIYYYIWQAKGQMAHEELSGLHVLIFIPVLIPLWNFLAMRHILKDEKLIRSMDRLR